MEDSPDVIEYSTHRYRWLYGTIGAVIAVLTILILFAILVRASVFNPIHQDVVILGAVASPVIVSVTPTPPPFNGQSPSVPSPLSLVSVPSPLPNVQSPVLAPLPVPSPPGVESPVPPPPLLPSSLPMFRALAMGELCTSTVADFLTLDPMCATDWDPDFCLTRSNHTTERCIRETCTAQFDLTLDMTPLPPWQDETFGARISTSLGTNVTLIAMIQKLVVDNWDAVLPAQPIDHNVLFTDSDYEANVSFAMNTSRLPVVVLVAQWNFLMVLHQQTAQMPILTSAVYMPAWCPTQLGHIPWLQGNNVTFMDVFWVTSAFFEVVTPSVLNSSLDTIQAVCYQHAGAGMCDWLIPRYYSVESLSDFSAQPSLYEDLVALLLVAFDECKECGSRKPTGCMGVPI